MSDISDDENIMWEEERSSISEDDLARSEISNLFAEQSTVKEESHGRLDPIRELSGSLDPTLASFSIISLTFCSHMVQ
jgi:hypothetical protein